MNISDVKATAFAMPLTSPAFPRGPYRFINREFLIITYRTDPDALNAVVPEPLEILEPLVRYEFIRMPDSSGFGDYTESGQVIPVSFRGKKGNYVHAMYLNDNPSIAGGRELWGFPKKFASPKLDVRDRYTGGHTRLREGAHRHGDDGIQASRGGSCRSAGRTRRSQFPAENHSTRRRFSVYL